MKHIIIQCIIFVFVFSAIGESRSSEESKNSASEKSIQGIAAIKDFKFKKDLSTYLTLSENFDYINEYSYLSKEYLKRFPDVKNEKDYQTHKYNKSEIGYLKYLEILECEKINNNQYKVILLVDSESEGDKFLFKEINYFIFESDKWKFNGREILEYLKQGEEQTQNQKWNITIGSTAELLKALSRFQQSG